MVDVVEKLKGFKMHEQLVLLASRRTLTESEKEYMCTLIESPGFNWHEFLGIAFINRVNGIIYKNLADFKKIPKYVMFFLKMAYNEQCYRTKAHVAEILDVSAELEKNNIKHAFLKGAVLNTLVYNAGERISNDTDLMVNIADIDKTVELLKNMGYAQGKIREGKFEAATKKEILFQRMNTYEIVPLAKPVDERYFPFHEIDINFRLGNDATKEESEELVNKSIRIGKEGYEINTFPLEEFLLFLCIHHYREAVMVFKIVKGDDLTLYKFMDIHFFVSKYFSDISWEKLQEITTRMNRIKDVYYTLFYTETLYPGTIPEEVLDMFKPEDTAFLNEYRGRDNTDEVYTWKMDFVHRVFSYDRQLEAMENIGEENERYRKIKDIVKGQNQ